MRSVCTLVVVLLVLAPVTCSSKAGYRHFGINKSTVQRCILRDMQLTVLKQQEEQDATILLLAELQSRIKER